MRRCYIVSGIFLILPIIGFAVPVPVLVQDKRQAPVSVKSIPDDSITMLRKRGIGLNKLVSLSEDHFAKPEESPATHPSSSLPQSENDDGWTRVEKPPSSPEKPSTESSHESTVVDAPLSTQVFPTWFNLDNADHELKGAHESQANLRPSIASDSDHRLAVDEPPSGPSSSNNLDTNQDYHVAHSPPPALPVEYDPFHWKAYGDMPDRRSISADSHFENLQTISEVLKGRAKESHRTSGIDRDVLTATQRELQHEVA